MVEVVIQRKGIEYRIVGGTGACGRAQCSTFPVGIAYSCMMHESAYERYQCLHAFCKAHHLRELIAIAERSPSQPWATDMIALLCQANALVGEAQNLRALAWHNSAIISVAHGWLGDLSAIAVSSRR